MRQRPMVRTLLILMLVLIGAQTSGRPQGAVSSATSVTMTLPLLHRFAVGLPTDDVAVLPLSRTVLLAQEAGKRALVLDEGTGHMLAALALPTGARHVAADPALGQIYLPDEFSGQLVVARLMAGWGHLLTTTVTVGRQPHGVAVDPRTHRVYVGNERGNTVSVVDGRRLRVQATVPVGRTPGGVAAAPLSGLVYVVLVGENRVAILNGRLGRVVRAVGVGTAPTHLALDPGTERAAVVNTDSGTLSLVDGPRGTASAPLRVGNAPYSVAVDGPRGLIFVASARQPTLTIVDSRKGRVRGTVRLDMVGGALAVDSGRRLLIVAGASGPSVEVFSYQGL